MFLILTLFMATMIGAFLAADSAAQQLVMVSLGCFFALIARMAQAAKYHDELQTAMKRQAEMIVDGMKQRTE